MQPRWPLVTFAGVVLAGIVFIYEIIPRVRTTCQNTVGWLHIRNQIENAENWHAQLSALQSQISTTEDALHAFYASPAGSDQVSSVLVALQKSAENINILEIRPGERAREDGYTRLPLDIVLTGRFTDVATFIMRLERSSQLMRVEEFEIEVEEAFSALLKAKLKLSAIILGGSA